MNGEAAPAPQQVSATRLSGHRAWMGPPQAATRRFNQRISAPISGSFSYNSSAASQ